MKPEVQHYLSSITLMLLDKHPGFEVIIKQGHDFGEPFYQIITRIWDQKAERFHSHGRMVSESEITEAAMGPYALAQAHVEACWINIRPFIQHL